MELLCCYFVSYIIVLCRGPAPPMPFVLDCIDALFHITQDLFYFSCLSLGLLHDSMVYRHEPTYTHYLAQLKENQLIMQQNEVRKREQQAREDRMKGKSVVNNNETSGSGGATGTFAMRHCSFFLQLLRNMNRY